MAVAATRDKGMDPADAERPLDFGRRIYWTLTRLAGEGKAVKTGQGMAARWALVGS